MPENNRQQLQHLIVERTARTEAYATKGRGPRLNTPPRNRRQHATRLLRQFRGLRTDIEAIQQERLTLGFDPRSGLLLQFESSPDFDLKFDSLDLKRQGIQLLSVQQREGRTIAVCYVPDGQLEYFVSRIEAYRDEDTRRGRPKNRELVESINAVRIAAIDALWTDPPEQMPVEGDDVWWELWMRADAPIDELRQAAETVGIAISREMIEFPERRVLTVRGTKQQLSQSTRLLNSIAELRRGKSTAADFVDLPPRAQHQLTEQVLRRVQAEATNAAACILDTGVTQAHPLLRVGLAEEDCYSWKPDWGPADSAPGHGTEMAGLALFGNLVEILETQEPIVLEHRLESVKILSATDPNPPHLYGAVTIEGAKLAEAANPEKRRVFGMAVTAESLEQGEPSTWSAAVDSLTSGYEDEQKRLLVVSAGNSAPDAWNDHPNGCLQSGVQDPGQSWNALTVGACTFLTRLDEREFPDWRAVAQEGDVSPYSSTSCSWTRPWPLKPELVLEGGNCARDPDLNIASELDSLSLLSTHWRPADRPFSLLRQTSAATALITRFAAILNARYPTLWPESVRALLVHSASWTDAAQQHFAPLDTREHKEQLLRYCGYGVPDFERACWSANSELTLIAQDSLQPYGRNEENGRYVTKDINFHSLPWPTDVLRQLGGTEVELRVTLSYFIEPNPARRGWKRRYRYASHALRFEVKTAVETEEAFRRRVNVAARSEDDEQEYEGDAADWALGPQLRHLGSIHSDWWKGTARDLADRHQIAVFPIVGWWRERPHLGRWGNRARYSLVISIRTPSEEIDIYSPVAAEIAAAIDIDTDESED